MISATTLHCIFKKHGIRFKRCISKNGMTDAKKDKIVEDQIKAVREALMLKDQGYMLVYLDETNFMPKKHTAMAFAKKNTNQTLEKDGIRAKTMSAVVTISSDCGLLEFMIAEGAFDTDRFVLFLGLLRQKVGH